MQILYPRPSGRVALGGVLLAICLLTIAAGPVLATHSLTPGPAQAPAWTFYDIDGDSAWDGDDIAYIDADDDGHVSEGDVRLGAFVDRGFGTQVQTDDRDVGNGFHGLTAFEAVCFVDDDGDGARGLGEPVYASTDSCTDTAQGDLRLTGTGAGEAGTKVATADSDFHIPLTPFDDAEVAFRDLDADQAYGIGDPVYLDHRTVGTLEAVDLELTRNVTDASQPGPVDSDGDGLLDAREPHLGTDPLDADTDDDGLEDGEEVDRYATDPLAYDTDQDGLGDGAEVHHHGTDPLAEDTDGDGQGDGHEVVHGSDPNDPRSVSTPVGPMQLPARLPVPVPEI